MRQERLATGGLIFKGIDMLKFIKTDSFVPFVGNSLLMLFAVYIDFKILVGWCAAYAIMWLTDCAGQLYPHIFNRMFK